MVASRIIENKVAGLLPATVFSIEDLGFPPEWWENVRVKLGRMVGKGFLEKAGRGKYYKPKSSVFGNIGPDTSEIVKDLLYDGEEAIGYLTGYGVWGQMGLTSQISNIIVVGVNRRRDSMTRGKNQVRFIMQPNKITAENIPLFQILDSLKLLKQIPDTSVDKSVSTLKNIIVGLEGNKLQTLVELAVKYPPRVRALTGAILESLGHLSLAGELKRTLNPITSYAIGISHDTLPNLPNWNIL